MITMREEEDTLYEEEDTLYEEEDTCLIQGNVGGG
jgi:hypothetical protein